MLGLDVHDCAHAGSEVYRKGPLQPGYVLTVEPGLYFQPDDLTVPEDLRGIGIRIEDDVVVTDGDPGQPVRRPAARRGRRRGVDAQPAAVTDAA
jgi:Xaa-Pro aminopeptidase